MNLTDAMNTYNSALWIIKEKNYKIALVDKEESFDWKASKDGNECIASDPLRLLALIIISEEKGEKWNHYEKDFYDEILEEFYGE
ncbi:hypothetical protein ACFO3O_20010 [Dokdonia ponticola]|uniref:Uncharacterized protein n=1 Tax=Dokdonia ponticola TaxID=2041041 RepID=A0ABV9I1Y6_9FLAO